MSIQSEEKNFESTLRSYPCTWSDILSRINHIDPQAYAKTRNNLSGQVTNLSPYITHGVIDTPFLSNYLLNQFSFSICEKLLFELGWREFFHQVWHFKKDAIFNDLEHTQNYHTDKMPWALLHSETSIDAIDQSLQKLQYTGHIHNHARMWIASLVCNYGQVSWKTGSRWMYYHLLDGDLASNSLSWQWVAKTFSNKAYWFNQDNINKYAATTQVESFVNLPYEAFPLQDIPAILRKTQQPMLTPYIPPLSTLSPQPSNQAIYLHHLWNLDPQWHAQEGRHILLIEPEILLRFPMHKRRIQWLIELAKNLIPKLEVVTQDFALFHKSVSTPITFKQYPLADHWQGICESRNWMFDITKTYYKRFFSFWKHHAKKTF